MAHFYGTLNGQAKNQATQCGSKRTGMVTQAAGWEGAIETHVYYDEFTGKDCFMVKLIPWQGSGGSEQVIASGVLDAGVAIGTTRRPFPKPGQSSEELESEIEEGLQQDAYR